MWEYKTLKIQIEKIPVNTKALDIATIESDLNRLGAFGWELVNVLDTSKLGSHNRYYLAFLKRRRLEDSRRE